MHYKVGEENQTEWQKFGIFPSTQEQSHILPSLQGIGRDVIPIYLEFQKSGYWTNSPNYWNSRNRSISKIGSTPGNTQIENFENSAYFWNSQNWKNDGICHINGIPKIGIYVKIVHISGIQKIARPFRFLEFH